MQSVDITQLILDDHHEQRRLFAILEQIDRSDTVALAALWGRLGTFLEVHALAEEELLYPELLRVGQGAGEADSATDETVDAIKDHNEIRRAVASVADEELGSSDWFDAVAAANEANSDHMAEEERQGLADLRQTSSLARRHDLAVRFAVFEANHVNGVQSVDRDPKAYIAEHA